MLIAYDRAFGAMGFGLFVILTSYPVARTQISLWDAFGSKRFRITSRRREILVWTVVSIVVGLVIFTVGALQWAFR